MSDHPARHPYLQVQNDLSLWAYACIHRFIIHEAPGCNNSRGEADPLAECASFSTTLGEFDTQEVKTRLHFNKKGIDTDQALGSDIRMNLI